MINNHNNITRVTSYIDNIIIYIYSSTNRIKHASENWCLLLLLSPAMLTDPFDPRMLIEASVSILYLGTCSYLFFQMEEFTR